MVRRFATNEGNFLYYTGTDGQMVIASQVGYDPLFAQLTEIITQQMVAVRENIAAQADYMNKLNNYQVNLSAGRLETTVPPLTVPVKPEYKLVADAPDADGNPVVTFVTWPTPLPEPIVPKVFKSQVNTF